MAPSDVLNHLSEPTKLAGDAGAIGIAIATFFAWLPNIVALLSLVWLLMRIVIGAFELRDWWRKRNA